MGKLRVNNEKVIYETVNSRLRLSNHAIKRYRERQPEESKRNKSVGNIRKEVVKRFVSEFRESGLFVTERNQVKLKLENDLKAIIEAKNGSWLVITFYVDEGELEEDEYDIKISRFW